LMISGNEIRKTTMTNRDIAKEANKENSNSKLRNTILSKLSERDKMYLKLQESIKERQKHSDEELTNKLSKDGKTTEKILEQIINQAKTGDLDKLKIASKRLEHVRRVMSQKDMNPKEYERLYGNITATQSVIAKDIKKKNSAFRKVTNIIRSNMIDAGSLAVGLTGGDPIVKFLVNKINKVKNRKSKRNYVNEQISADSAKMLLNAEPESKRKVVADDTKKTGVTLKNDGLNSKNDLVLVRLTEISESNKTISTDIQKLVRIFEADQDRKDRTSLSDADSRFESMLKRPGGLGKTQKADPNFTGAKETESIFKKALEFLGFDALLGGGALATLMGIASSPVVLVAGSVLALATEGIMGYLKSGQWGVSSISAVIGGIFGGAFDNKLFNFFANMGTWAITGAAAGSVIPGVGTLFGGLIGALFGGVMGLFGGEKIAKWLDAVGVTTKEIFNETIDNIVNTYHIIVNGILDLFSSISTKIAEVKNDAAAALGLAGPNEDLKTKEMKGLSDKGQKTVRKIQELEKEDPETEGRMPLEDDTSYYYRIKDYKNKHQELEEELKKSNQEDQAPKPENIRIPEKIPGNSEALNLLNKSLDDANITDPKERSAFLAQTSYESGGFKDLKEKGNSSYFSRYEGRKDLGNVQRGDGEKYKGRGYIQLTGRDNYRRIGQMIGVDLENNPQLLERPDIAAKASVAYWQSRVKPNVSDFSDTRKVTKMVQGSADGGGSIGQRQMLYAAYSQQPPAPKADATVENAKTAPPMAAQNSETKELDASQKSLNKLTLEKQIAPVNIINQGGQGSNSVNMRPNPVSQSPQKTGIPYASSMNPSVLSGLID